MKTTLVLEDGLLRKAKKRAAELGMSLSAFTEQLIRDALVPKRGPARRVVLPTVGQGLPKYAHSVEELRALETEDSD